ncbi:MAG: hypothetical protein V7K30_05540 [Nostoc sp.]
MGETNNKFISFKLHPLIVGVILTPNSCTDAINRVSNPNSCTDAINRVSTPNSCTDAINRVSTPNSCTDAINRVSPNSLLLTIPITKN